MLLKNFRILRLITVLLISISSGLYAAPSDHFVTTWETTAVNTVITIPTFAGETYNYAIDWDNDMVPDETGITGDATHDYGSAGVHTIRIFGTFPRIYINNGTEKDKILSIEQWGTNQWTSMERAFQSASNLIINATDTPDLSICSSLLTMFNNATNIGNGTANWDWDTSNIVIMASMFASATSFDEDISSWNIENVTNFTSMFNGVILSNANYDALLIGWNNQNVNPNISFTGGFSQYCSQAAQDARANLIANDGWTITDGGLDPACNTGIASDHFVITFDTSIAGSTGSTSFNIPTTGSGYNYNIDSNNDGNFNFTGVTGGVDLNYVSPGIKTIRIAGDFPRIFFNQSGDKDKILSIEQWGTNSWTSMNNAFSGANNLVINATDTPDLSICSSLLTMFNNATNIGNGTANWDWDTSNIVIMASMFASATSFDEDISSWNIENVTNFTSMFTGATLSDANYDALLVSWNNQNVNPNRLFTGGLSQYCSQAAQDARANLIATDGWTITDGGLCSEPLFRTTWKTDNPGTSNDTSITIPTEPTATYAYQVDWNGDGDFDDTDEEIIHTGDATHDYGAIQTNQTINIKGLFPQIYFNNSGDKDKIISIDQWGSNPWTSMIRAFEGSSNLINKASDIPDLSNVDSLLRMFDQASSIGSSLDTGNWNWEINNIRFFSSMFSQATSFNKDIGNWDTSNAETFSTMFQLASSFNQDISNWSTANVVVVGNMFNLATSFNQDLSGWNFEAVFLNFNGFLKDTAFSTENYDALLIAWDNQSIQPGLILDVGTITYCSQAAVDARANLTTADMWTITDGGHTNACDVLFENSFEDVIIVKSAKQQVSYDFSKVSLNTLSQEPQLIIQGTDDNNNENMRIHIRNDLGVMQVRVSYLRDEQWTAQQWFDVDNNTTIILQW